MSSDDELVKLNVGGKSFTTYKSTFLKHPHTMLARMFSTSAQLAKQGNGGEYFIDRNPEIFSVILEFYRTNQFLVPKTISLEALFAELEYFGIDYEEEDIEVVGEPIAMRRVLDDFISLSRAYSALPKKGHLLGKVVIGFPEPEFWDESSKYDEAKTNFTKSFRTINNSKKFASNSLKQISQDCNSDDNKESDNEKQFDYDSDDKSKEIAADQWDNWFKSFKKLKDALSDISANAVFCCGGEISIPEVLDTTLKMSAPNTEGEPSDYCGTVKNLNIEKVKSRCVVAPFGDLTEMQTKVDLNVRDALECDRKRYDLPLNLKEEIKYISKVMNYNKDIKFVPYKLNLYGPGGFFKEHVDTPVNSSAMIGSLVLCLPSEHEGGELVVSHEGVTHTFDFAKQSKDNSKIQWAAFYSDCVHEVKQVVSGTRITVTYLIEMGKDYSMSRYQDIQPQSEVSRFLGTTGESSFMTSLTRVLSTVGHVGIFLSHKYTTSAISLETLKGTDKLLIEKLSTNNEWNYQLLSVIYLEQTEEHHEFEYFHARGLVYAFTMDDLKYLNNKGEKPIYTLSGVPFVASDQKGKRLHHNKQESAEYTGNYSRPAEEDSVYFHAVVIVSRAQ